MDPPILILDEPTNSLDDNSRRLLCRFLRERKSGAVIVTHDDILNGAANAAYIIKEGKVIKHD